MVLQLNFKTFLEIYKGFFVKSINYGYIKAELSESQKCGIITSLPKGDKPSQFLKNWRPIIYYIIYTK